jgi:hypothetical protein
VNLDEFEYDVAFSFTQQDEDVAFKLYKLLKDRLTCFIYSEEQKKLAGGNGEALFNSVFSKESRIVVILYRNQYGKTKWTRIEETAIRNRGFDEGYDFVILIPLDSPVTPPEWLPKNRLWVGFDRWGIESAASIIEARVQEYGGVVKLETIADIVVRTETELKEKLKRERVLNSEEGLNIAIKEIEEIVKLVSEHIEEIRLKAPDWKIMSRPNKQNCINVISYGYHLTFQWHQQYINSLLGTHLFVALLQGYFDEDGYSTDLFNKNKLIDSNRLRFDIDELNQNGWSLQDTRKKFMTTRKLVDYWIDKLVTNATNARLENG